MIHAWGFEDSLTLNEPSWSISAEWFAYLVFPFLALLLLKVSNKNLLLYATIFSFIFIWLLSVVIAGLPVTEWTYQFSVLRIFPEFSLGIASYMYAIRSSVLRQPQALIMTIISGIILMFLLQAMDVLIVILFAVLIGLLFMLEKTPEMAMYRFLSHRWFVWLGESSYSLYMVHYIILSTVLGSVTSLGTEVCLFIVFPFYVSASLAVAALVHTFLEVPAQKWVVTSFVRK